MMSEVLFVMLGLLVAFNVGHLLTLTRCETALFALTMESKALTQFDPSAIIEDMREDLAGIVQDMVGGMRTPTVADHLGGMMAQFAQMRMMKMMNAEGMIPGAVGEVIDDGNTFD